MRLQENIEQHKQHWYTSALPEGEMCRQEMEGSGFPVAKQVRVTLVPSLMVISLEMSYIFGGTEMVKHAMVRNIYINIKFCWTLCDNSMIPCNVVWNVLMAYGHQQKIDSLHPQDFPRVFLFVSWFIFLSFLDIKYFRINRIVTNKNFNIA